MKKCKNFQKPIALSFTKLGSIVLIIFLCYLFMITRNCFSQYSPEVGDRVTISIMTAEKPQLFENASDSSRSIQRINNGETLKILEKNKNWLKIKLVSGEIGWLYVEPRISNFMLINIGQSKHKAPVSKQKVDDENEFWKINISAQYRNLPDTWDIRYYGLEPEFFLSDKFSVSGIFYAGKGSDDHAYIHVPIFGLLVSLSLGFILNEVFDGEFYSKHIFRFLIVEKFNYHQRLNKFFIVSPYLSLLGMDVSEVYGPNRHQTALLTNGIGLNARLLLGKRVTVGPSFGLKHFIDIDNSFDSKKHFGYTVGVNLGIIF